MRARAGIEHDVACQLQRVGVLLDHDRLESSLKKVTDTAVFAVVPLRVATVQLFHAFGQTRRGGFNEQVVGRDTGASSRIVTFALDNPACCRVRSRDKGRRNIQYEGFNLRGDRPVAPTITIHSFSRDTALRCYDDTR